MRESCRILAAALLGLLCSACSVTRHIPEGQYFLQKVKIEDDRSTPRKERITASDMEKYVRQTPNKRFLGTNFYVWLYEQADPAKDNRWNNWKRKIGSARDAGHGADPEERRKPEGLHGLEGFFLLAGDL